MEPATNGKGGTALFVSCLLSSHSQKQADPTCWGSHGASRWKLMKQILMTQTNRNNCNDSVDLYIICRNRLTPPVPVLVRSTVCVHNPVRLFRLQSSTSSDFEVRLIYSEFGLFGRGKGSVGGKGGVEWEVSFSSQTIHPCAACPMKNEAASDQGPYNQTDSQQQH